MTQQTTDTIAAISTPVGEGGIAIIRVSGPDALTVGDSVFTSANGHASTFPSHTVHYGAVGINGNKIDTVMLTVMHAPRTYTGDHTVEINCHGGILTARHILGLCLANGARLAEPGEFTRRAFLAGKLDLTQAEAVMDLITAKTDRAQAAAQRALDGALSSRVNLAREELLQVLAHLEAYIDFPEDDIAPETMDKLGGQLATVTTALQRLLETSREGRIMRHGVSVALIGRPNAGKSSLMNALLGHDRAIVTEVPGTTRDTIDEFCSIGGVPVCLTDTAGIREANETVERIGVERSRKSLATSDLLLHVIDGSVDYHRDDTHIATHYADRPVIVVINKSDLTECVCLPSGVAELLPVRVSATTGMGLDDLRNRLLDKFHLGLAGNAANEVHVNERHARALRVALDHLGEAAAELKRAEPPEIVSQHLRFALDAMGEIVGKTTTEDILDKIFSQFCIGK